MDRSVIQACADTYEAVYGESPKKGSMVTPDGETVYIHTGQGWMPLCPIVSGDPGERVEFEIFPDLVIESDPHGLMEVILAAQGIDPKTSVDTVGCFFKILKECGWNGPMTQIPGKIPGEVYVIREDSEENLITEDIKPVLGQLRSPEFSGILEVVEKGGRSTFINMKDVNQLQIETAEECDEQEIRREESPLTGLRSEDHRD
jgi:hypothetical protein